MATSLYDQYHSEKNTTHIYNLIDTLVKRKTSQSIKQEPNNFNIYNHNLKNIFIKSDNDTLEKLNRELILHHVQYFVNEIESQQTPPPAIPPRRSLNSPMQLTELSSLPKKDDIPEMSFEDLIKQRNNDTLIKDKPLPLQSNESKQTDISSLSNDKSEMMFEDLIDQPPPKNDKIKSIITNITENEQSISISSMNRLDERTNRFNYQVELKNPVKTLNRVILPIEQNIYFSLPILKLIIPEFKYETDIVCERTYIFNHRKMGIYIPLDRDIDYVETETITIILSNRFNSSIIEPDIIEIDVDDNKISLDQKDLYHIGDIVNIEDKYIGIGATFDIEYKTELEKVQVKNTNLQNLLIFN